VLSKNGPKTELPEIELKLKILDGEIIGCPDIPGIAIGTPF
jgi:hypothetical protein